VGGKPEWGDTCLRLSFRILVKKNTHPQLTLSTTLFMLLSWTRRSPSHLLLFIMIGLSSFSRVRPLSLPLHNHAVSTGLPNRAVSTGTAMPTKALLKTLSALHTPKGRKADPGSLLVEGFRSIKDITTVYSGKPALHPKILIAYSDLLDGELREVGDSTTEVYDLIRGTSSAEGIMKKLSDTATPSGAFALFDRPPSLPPSPLPEDAFLLVSSGVSDPGNVGTLMRTYLAAGFTGGCIALPGSADPASSKVIRASTGVSQFAVPSARILSASPEALIDHMDCLLPNGWTLLVATMEGSTSRPSVPYTAPEIGACSGLIIGNEGGGVAPELMELVRTGDPRFLPVHVPMCSGVESMNAGVVGAIVMFEAKRAREISSAAKGGAAAEGAAAAAAASSAAVKE